MHDLGHRWVHLADGGAPDQLKGCEAMTRPDQLAVIEHVPAAQPGASPIVVLVHGSLDRSASFTRVVRRLDDLHTVVYDRRGYNRSRDALPLNATLDGHVDDLVSVIDGRPSIVVGHSYGGDVALAAALRPASLGSILAVAAYEPPTPWLPVYRSSPDAAPRGSPAEGDADDPEAAADAAERFFRRMVGDASWERLPETAKAARRADGPALAAELRAIRLAGGPVRCDHNAGAGDLWLRGELGGPPPAIGELAARAHARGRAVRDRRRLARGPSHPPRCLRRHGALGRGPGPASGRHRPMNVLLAGGSGLIGTALGDRLRVDGHQVTRLVRGPGGSRPKRDEVGWDPALGIVDLDRLDRSGPIDGVVNLAGAGIGDRRWSRSRKEVIVKSRIDSTRLLVDTFDRLSRHPSVLVSASAVGFYGDRGEEVLTEASAAGTGFLAGLCRAWEQAAGTAADSGTRTVFLRSGIVVARSGGALARQLPLFRLGLGGHTGTGAQFRSWISLDDEVAVIVRCLVDEGLSGPVNATAPNPVTDRALAKAIGAALHRPVALHVPAGVLRLALGAEMADELVLGGQRARPAALEARGHEFAHTEVGLALQAAVSPGP